MASLASQAAALAVAAGETARAVELLEQTRGILVADTIDLRRGDLTQLRRLHPRLATDLDEIRSRIEYLEPSDGLSGHLTRSKSPKLDRARLRQAAHSEWQHLIDQIRLLDGFKGFLQAPAIRELAAEAHTGPVVFIYTTSLRSDALILTDDPSSPIQLIPLDTLTEATAHKQVHALLNAQQEAQSADAATRLAAESRMMEVLAWTWDAITGPVITALGYTAPPADDQPWPRVWWCPVGILAYLPLHAAGHHEDAKRNTDHVRHPRAVLDRVVSSYITTLRCLAYARTRKSSHSPDDMVIIAVPDAPGAAHLPGVAQEARTLARLVRGARILPSPTRDAVLSALAISRIAHFTCHGYSDWAAPSASRLILHDHQTAPLTITDISLLRNPGELAYLSACETAVTSPQLTDEAIHIAGAFHLAGYQQVIGTLWPIPDAASRDHSYQFYSHLTNGGTNQVDTCRAPYALHHATRYLREQQPANPISWAAYTHTGI